MPPETARLYRVSLNPAHWRQVRRLLAVETVAAGLVGAIGLGGMLIRGQSRVLRPLGLPLTPALCIGLLVLAAAAAAATMSRSAAKVFLVVMISAALGAWVSNGLSGCDVVEGAPRSRNLPKT